MKLLKEILIEQQALSVITKVNRNSLLKEELMKLTFYMPIGTTISQRLYHVKNEIKQLITCSCGKPAKFISFNKGYYTHCSQKCGANSIERHKKRKETCIQRYGVEYSTQATCVKEKTKQTNLRRYGVENPSQNIIIRNKQEQTCIQKYGVKNPLKNSIIKNKMRNTCIEKYGVNNPSKAVLVKEKKQRIYLEKYGVNNILKSPFIKEKIKQTNLERYGAENPFGSSEIIRKKKDTWLKKYGVDNPNKVKNILNKQRLTRKIGFYKNLLQGRLTKYIKPLFSLEEYEGVANKYKFQCVKCNNIFEDNLDNGRIPRCLICNPFEIYSSKYEDELFNWLLQLDITRLLKHDRSVINPYQLDIYLPDHKLAIEFNGLYWHSELGGNKDKNYHLNKTNLCKEKGIELIHIFEDEWIHKQDIVKSIIKNKLGLIENKIYARECIIKEVGKEEALLFLMNNHLQESIICKYFVGLYHNNTLVQLIGIGKSRFNKNYAHELLRSCSKVDTVVIGGFNKLMNYSIDNLSIDNIVSYVDKRYFNGKGYKEWKLIDETKPNYFYMKEYQNRESRLKYQKHKIIDKEEDKSLTEWQLMQLKGYDRIWDCGNLTFDRKKLC